MGCYANYRACIELPHLTLHGRQIRLKFRDGHQSRWNERKNLGLIIKRPTACVFSNHLRIEDGWVETSCGGLHGYHSATPTPFSVADLAIKTNDSDPMWLAIN